MINALLIISVVIGLSLQHITKKAYNQKLSGKGVICFSALSSGIAALFFIFQVKLPLQFEQSLIPYAVIFGLGFGSCVVCSILAILNGSLSLTSLITSYSLIIPTLYGIIFLNEKKSEFLIIGLVLLLISLFLINFVKGDTKISFKWLIYVVIAFWGNGVCSTAQKVQQEDFGGKFKAEFMSVSLIIVVLVLLVYALFTEKKDIVPSIKKGYLPLLICGIANAIVNLFVMILSVKMSASVMFPLISAGSIILTYLISRIYYKEKLNKMQNAGFIFGVASVVFLNL